LTNTSAKSRADFVINNCRAVLTESILDEASVRVENGRIAEIAQGRSFGDGLDARDAWLLPGLIDIHSDAIEKAVEPRPRARFPTEIAVRELDRQLAACGITTMFHSLSFADMEDGLRSNNAAAAIIEEIHDLVPRLRIDTRIHARFEVTDLGALPYLERLVSEGKVGLLSFMDHSPGQGQYRDVTAYKGYYGKVYDKSDAELDRILARKAQARENGVQEAIQGMMDLCRRHFVSMASHDDDSPERIEWCRREGLAISEFPTNLATARAGRDAGVRTCLGAPNLVRGGSQANNLSARAALEDGCGDILCSDYLPLALLHAVFALDSWGVRRLPQAVAMASLAPALATGIGHMTGSVEVGKCADLILVERRHGHPDLLRTWSRGREVYASC
jgi:alpha-D-ribose 1-methylphosphonate 5-triphosphate diphosphatase